MNLNMKVISTLLILYILAFYNSKNELVLSRDHVGIKPLFSLNKSGLIFSSEIKVRPCSNSNKIDRLALSCTSLLGVNV